MIKRNGVWRLLYYGVFAATISSLHATHRFQEVYGRSFMFTHPASARLTRNQQLWHAITYDAQTASGVQAIVFYEQSISKERVARYFLINGKSELLVAGDTAPALLVAQRDVRAEWLGLPANFSGRMTISPQQRQAGFSLEYHQDLCAITDIPFIKNWWIHVYVPFLWVQNDIRLCQFDVRNLGNGSESHDIIHAFSQSHWQYGKMRGREQLFRPAEVRFSLGSTYRADSYYEFIYYTTFLVPFAHRANPTFLFSPMIGYNGHAGVGGGVNFQVPLNRDVSTCAWLFFIDLESIYLFGRRQCRTFDLKDKPWSRYLFYNVKKGPPNQDIPGVNLLTFDVTSHPYGVAEFTTGLRFRSCAFEAELGYGIWGRPQEKLSFRAPFAICDEFGIAGVGPLGIGPSTRSLSTISEQAPVNDEVFVPVRKEDIDLCSGAAASAVNHIIHTAFGTVIDRACMHIIVGSGAFIEFAQRNRPLSLWGVWFKVGAMF